MRTIRPAPSRQRASRRVAAITGAVAIILIGAGCAADPAETTRATAGTVVADRSCATDLAGEGSTPLREILVDAPPPGYMVGWEQPVSEEEFLVHAGPGRESYEGLFERTGFDAAYQRTWVPADGPRDGREDEDTIYAYAVCLPTVEQAQVYAAEGATDPLLEHATRDSLPATDSYLVVVRDGVFATALLRTGRTVVMFVQGSDAGDVDEQVLRDLVDEQAAQP